MRTPDSIAELAAALAAFNAEVANPVADQVAQVHSKRTGTDFTYPYADLGGISDLVRPALARHGLSVMQLVCYDNARGWVGAKTVVLHSSGQSLEFPPVWVPVPDDGSAQDIGKAISYSRRYGYLASLGLAAREDADGPAASGRRQQKPAQTIAPKPATPAPPAAIGRQRAAALVAIANRKGKTAAELLGFAVALGLAKDKRLEDAAPAMADRIKRRLEALPDAFDANGEAIAPAPSGEAPADGREVAP